MVNAGNTAAAFEHLRERADGDVSVVTSAASP